MCSDAKTSSRGYFDVRCVRSAENAMSRIVFVSRLDEVELGIGNSGKLCTVVTDVVGGVVVWNGIASGCSKCVFKCVEGDKTGG